MDYAISKQLRAYTTSYDVLNHWLENFDYVGYFNKDDFESKTAHLRNN